MFQGDRQVVPGFEGIEPLFLRYRAEDFLTDHLAEHSIRSQMKQSVNRGLFSEPADVLFDEEGKYNGLGVVGFRVDDITCTVKPAEGHPYNFFMKHIPLSNNYAHSEIWSDQDPPTIAMFKRPSKTALLEFRIRLCRVITKDKICIVAAR